MEDSPDEDKEFFCSVSRSYFDSTSLINHQISSFNAFLHQGIHDIFEQLPPLEIHSEYNLSQIANNTTKHVYIKFGKVTLKPPDWTDKDGAVAALYPTEARMRKMTYNAAVLVDINVKAFVSNCSNEDKTFRGKDKVFCKKGETGSFETLTQKQQMKVDNLVEDTTLESVFIGRIPIMVKCDLCYLKTMEKADSFKKALCTLDSGGYFIINGSEKVLIAQESLSKEVGCNRLKDKNGMSVGFTSVSATNKSQAYRITVKLNFLKKKQSKMTVPDLSVHFLGLLAPINVIIVFRALGVCNDKEMIERICEDLGDLEMAELVLPSLRQANVLMTEFLKSRGEVDDREHIYSPTECLKYIEDHLRNKTGNKGESVQEHLDKCFLPHLTLSSRKVLFLSYMVNFMLSCHLGRRKEQSTDSFKNKRLQLACQLFETQLKKLLWRFQRDLDKKLHKFLQKDGYISKRVESQIDRSIITNGFRTAFSTGNWASEWRRTTNSGVVATLKRNNYMESLTHLRQMRSPIQTSAKLGDSRYQNKSFIGRICLVETPDSENCGLVKTLAVSSHVSLGSSEKPIIDAIYGYCVLEFEGLPPSKLKDLWKIFLNGKWVGICQESGTLTTHLRAMRRRSLLNHEVEIVEDKCSREIKIFCDAGRLLRPLIIVNEKQPPWPCLWMDDDVIIRVKVEGFKYFLANGLVELVGAGEEECCVVAMGYKELKSTHCSSSLANEFTHCEIHPSYHFGLGASLVPFANHNHSSRVMMQAQKHGKQAIGLYTTCPNLRHDTSSHQLFYLQRPLASTMTASLLANQHHLGNGQNAIVAVSPFLGYNQEDSLVINGSSIDRGLFKSLHFRSFTVDLDDENERFMKPTPTDTILDSKYARFDKLESDGFPFIGADLVPRDVFVGKGRRENETARWKDTSSKLRMTEKGRVDQVVLTMDGDENRVAKVRLREARSPVVGDKFSSRHGQKGVVGFVCPQEDMIFCQNGIVPDIIINPHAFPSRQTPGQLIESVLAKVIAVSGKRRDATPFGDTTPESIMEALHRLGYEGGGKEMMCNGSTGAMIKSRIFIGPTFYQRLIHMAEDKLKFRREGPVHPLTRQPVADRKRHGGVKIGEMERDCLIAHGAMANLHERLFLLSDPYVIHICNSCHMVASKDTKGYNCRFCKSNKALVQVPMPYACKLLYQELLGMGICIRFFTKPC